MTSFKKSFYIFPCRSGVVFQNRTDQVVSYINGLEGHQPVIVLILDAQTILDIADAITKKGLDNVPIWIAATVGLRQMGVIQAWKRVFHGGVVLEPYLPELEQFQRYFTHALRVKLFTRRTFLQFFLYFIPASFHKGDQKPNDQLTKNQMANLPKLVFWFLVTLDDMK